MLFPVFAWAICDTDTRLQCCFVFIAKCFSLESAVTLLDKFWKEAIDDTLGKLEITDWFLVGRLFKAKGFSLESAVFMLEIFEDSSDLEMDESQLKIFLMRSLKIGQRALPMS